MPAPGAPSRPLGICAARRPLNSRGRLRGGTLLLTLAALASLSACAEEPLPQRQLRIGDCLNRIDLEQLPQALERCNRVVAAFPREPQPLNERFLLQSLLGQEQAACRDIRQASKLASRLPPARLDRLLRRDLQLRLASCRD